MDIQLQTSFYLLTLRIGILCMAVLATLTSNLNWAHQLLLCAVVLLQVKSSTRGHDRVCSLQFSKDDSNNVQTCGKKVVLELSNRRRIELTLAAYYCLWWVQILYLRSTHRTAIVIVLPDSCSNDERRQLRQILSQ